MQASHINYFKIVPPIRKVAIPRDRLTSRLCKESLTVKVTLVCADAGYGKTTLLRDFTEGCGTLCAWYRLDRSDRDIAQFFTYLAHSIQRHFPSFGTDQSFATGSLTAADPAYLAFLLVRELDSLECRSLAVVLDNYEAVNESEEVNAFVASLIEYLPQNVHMIIGSRERPVLPLTRLRAQQDLLELDEQDLAFTGEELRQVLSRVCDAGFGDEEIRLLEEKTEGWAAGLIIAGLSLKHLQGEARTAFLDKLSGSTRAIYDYLAVEVLQKQPQETQSFLLQTSVLPRLYVDICNEIANISNSHEILSGLEDSGLFTHRVGDDHTCFRYHRLFREFLADRLITQWRSEDVRALRLKAGTALEARGHFTEAHKQYTLAGSPDIASDLVEKVAQDYLDRGMLETVAHWFSLTPERIMAKRPWLLYYQSQFMRLTRNGESAMRVLDQAYELFEEQGDLQGMVSVIYEKSIIGFQLGHCAEGIKLAERMLLHVGDNAHLRARLLNALCRNSFGMQELDTAERYASLALREISRLRGEPAYGLLSNPTWRFLARIYTKQGKLDEALQAADRAMEVCQPERKDRLEWAWSNATRGSIFALQGRWAAAMQALKTAEETAGNSSYTLRAQINLWRGNIQRDTGDLASALDSYYKAGQIALPDLALLRLWSGHVDEAASLAEEGQLFFKSRDSTGDLAAANVVNALVQKARRRFDLARRGLEGAAALFEQKGLQQMLASTLMQLARLEHEVGSSTHALAHLGKAMEVAEANDFRYFLWLDSEAFSVIMGQALKNGIHVPYVCELIRFRLGAGQTSHVFPLLSFPDGRVQDHVSRILGEPARGRPGETGLAEDVITAFSGEQLPPKVLEYIARGVLTPELLVQLRGPHELTWREVEVYCAYYLQPAQGQLPEDLGRRYYARQLCMSENTLKIHINSIRRKMGLVQRRPGNGGRMLVDGDRSVVAE